MDHEQHVAVLRVEVPSLMTLAAGQLPISDAYRIPYYGWGSVDIYQREITRYYHLFRYVRDLWDQYSPHVCQIPADAEYGLGCWCSCDGNVNRPCHCLCLTYIDLLIHHLSTYDNYVYNPDDTMCDLLRFERWVTNRPAPTLRLYTTLEFDGSVQTELY